MSIKVIFLHSNLDRFSDYCDDMRDEQGKRFHLNINKMDECYQGRREK